MKYFKIKDFVISIDGHYAMYCVYNSKLGEVI
jgi:hypothetical protein